MDNNPFFKTNNQPRSTFLLTPANTNPFSAQQNAPTNPSTTNPFPANNSGGMNPQNQPVAGQDRGSLPQNQLGSKPNNIFGQNTGQQKINPF